MKPDAVARRLLKLFHPTGLSDSVGCSEDMDKTVSNLGLTSDQEDQLVAFLRTLTDGYKR